MVTFKFPFPLSRCQLFNQVFFEKSTPRHATPRPSHQFPRTSTNFTAEISREWRHVVASREHASTRGILNPRIRVITRITRQFFNSPHTGYRSIDPFTRGKEFRRCDSSFNREQSIARAINFNPCSLYRKSVSTRHRRNRFTIFLYSKSRFRMQFKFLDGSRFFTS